MCTHTQMHTIEIQALLLTQSHTYTQNMEPYFSLFTLLLCPNKSLSYPHGTEGPGVKPGGTDNSVAEVENRPEHAGHGPCFIVWAEIMISWSLEIKLGAIQVQVVWECRQSVKYGTLYGEYFISSRNIIELNGTPSECRMV